MHIITARKIHEDSGDDDDGDDNDNDDKNALLSRRITDAYNRITDLDHLMSPEETRVTPSL